MMEDRQIFTQYMSTLHREICPQSDHETSEGSRCMHALDYLVHYHNNVVFGRETVLAMVSKGRNKNVGKAL